MSDIKPRTNARALSTLAFQTPLLPLTPPFRTDALIHSLYVSLNGQLDKLVFLQSSKSLKVKRLG